MLKAEGADVVAIAKASGFSITTEDLKPLQPVSEAELEGMAGGFTPYLLLLSSALIKPAVHLSMNNAEG